MFCQQVGRMFRGHGYLINIDCEPVIEFYRPDSPSMSVTSCIDILFEHSVVDVSTAIESWKANARDNDIYIQHHSNSVFAFMLVEGECRLILSFSPVCADRNSMEKMDYLVIEVALTWILLKCIDDGDLRILKYALTENGEPALFLSGRLVPHKGIELSSYIISSELSASMASDTEAFFCTISEIISTVLFPVLSVPVFEFEKKFIASRSNDLVVHFPLNHLVSKYKENISSSNGRLLTHSIVEGMGSGNPAKICMALTHLTCAIQELMPCFELFRSKLVVDDHRHVNLVRCTTEEIINVMPERSINPNELADYEVSKNFFVPVKSLPGESLVTLTLTPTDSGIALGISMSHLVSDGGSANLFLGALYRLVGLEKFMLPSLQRSYWVMESYVARASIDALVRSSVSLTLDECDLVELSNETRVSGLYYPRYVEVHRFSDLPRVDEYGFSSCLKYPSNSIAMATMLVEFADRFGFHNTKDLQVKSAINARSRLPGLDDNYVGNAFIEVPITVPRYYVDRGNIPELARLIDTVFSKFSDPDYIESVCEVTEVGLSYTPPDTLGCDLFISNISAFKDLTSSSCDFMSAYVSAPVGMIILQQEGFAYIQLFSDKPFVYNERFQKQSILLNSE
tara:strand:- start:50035 stop:51918 length:1884 start_codon:yes stop_codon:yes gene_type:complete